MMTRELESRGASFERTKITPKGETTKVGVKQLISLLRTASRPNEVDESKISSKGDKSKCDFF